MLKERSRDNYFELNVLDPFMAGHNGFICGGCFKNLFNHEKIKEYQREEQIRITKVKRPDLYQKFLERNKNEN